MTVIPLMREGEPAGEVTAEREGLYHRFAVRGRLPEGLWCVWLVGEQGEVRLGIPEPQGNGSVLCRRISNRTVAPAGKLLRGEVRPVSWEEDGWERISRPEEMFQTDWIRRRLARCREARFCREEGRLLLALPYRGGTPFLLEPLFCFAKIRRIGGREFAVFAFDGAEQPLFP